VHCGLVFRGIRVLTLVVVWNKWEPEVCLLAKFPFAFEIPSRFGNLAKVELRKDGKDSSRLPAHNIGTNFLGEAISSKISSVIIAFSYPTPPLPAFAFFANNGVQIKRTKSRFSNAILKIFC